MVIGGVCGLLLILAQIVAGLNGQGAETFAQDDAAGFYDIVERYADAERCGVSGALGTSGYVEFGPTEMKCNRTMSTNCTITYHTACPEECPFRAPSNTFPCLFKCVTEAGCSAQDTGLAFADNATKLCKMCVIPNCRRCLSQTVCEDCYTGFVLSDERDQCFLAVEKRLHLRTVFLFVECFLGGLVLLALFYRRICGGENRWLSQNRDAIHRAMQHRHLTKVLKWSLTTSGTPLERYPLTTNLHLQHLMGEGMALFYNSLVFLMLFAGLAWFTTWIIFSCSGLGDLLGKLRFGDFLTTVTTRGGLAVNAVSIPGVEPAMIISPLASCQNPSSSDVGEKLRKYADMSFYGMGFLYITSFALSLAYGMFQKRASLAYKRRSTTMNDYAICVTGLPQSATDESVLRNWFQEEFAKALGKPQDDKEVQVYGVSIGYDYTDRMWEVECMTTRLIESVEVRFLHYNAEETTAAIAEPQGTTLDEMLAEDKKRVHAWFEEGSGQEMRSSGEVFVVMRHKVGVQAVLHHFSQPGVALHYEHGEDRLRLRFGDVKNEPVSTCWWHFGVKNILSRLGCASVKLLIMIASVQLLIVAPVAQWVIMPYVSGGNPAGGYVFVLAGTFLGWVNMLMCIQIYFTSYELGFHRKDRRDVVIFWANFALTFINNAFQICVTAIQVYNQTAEHVKPGSFFEVRSLVRFAKEHALARNVFLMLNPGMFFVGNLMCPIMAGLVPYLWNLFLMKVIYIWQCLPRPLLRCLRVFLPWAPLSIDRYPVRFAEKGLEGMELGLPWDYAGNIMFPTVCCFLLPLSSPHIWQVFRGLFCWAAFYYCFCRYMHLRFFRAQYYTTRMVDSHVNLAWGIPLSVIASSWCIWALRTDRFTFVTTAWGKYALTFGAFCLSYLLWFVVYMVKVQPFNRHDMRWVNDLEDPPVEEVKKSTLYTWFNCNPVYALKCKHLIVQGNESQWNRAAKVFHGRKFDNPIASGFDGVSVRYFEIGKEYLFFHKDKQPGIHDVKGDPLEFETYLDPLVRHIEDSVELRNNAADAAPQTTASEKWMAVLPLMDPVVNAVQPHFEALERTWTAGASSEPIHTESRCSRMFASTGSIEDTLSEDDEHRREEQAASSAAPGVDPV